MFATTLTGRWMLVGISMFAAGCASTPLESTLQGSAPLAVASGRVERAPLGSGLPCPITGNETAEEFVDLVDCYLTFLFDDSFAALPPEDQAELMGHAAVFSDVCLRLNDVLHNAVLPSISETDKTRFAFVLQQSGLLEELAATQVILTAELDGDQKKEAKKQTKESLTKVVDALVKALPDEGASIWFIELDFSWFKELIPMLTGTACEILAVLNAKT